MVRNPYTTNNCCNNFAKILCGPSYRFDEKLKCVYLNWNLYCRGATSARVSYKKVGIFTFPPCSSLLRLREDKNEEKRNLDKIREEIENRLEQAPYTETQWRAVSPNGVADYQSAPVDPTDLHTQLSKLYHTIWLTIS